MFVMRYPIPSLAIALALSLGLSRTGVAQAPNPVDAPSIEAVTVTVYRTKALPSTPAAKPETKGKAPSKDAIWVPGFWSLQGDRNTAPRAGWVWQSGRWLTPPARDAHWFPAHWGFSDGWWSWVPGHWTEHANWIPSTS
jgi:hypothetical protein